MRQARTITVLITLAALTGCDAILGPNDDPASIDVAASRTSFDWVGQTAQLEGEVRNDDGDVLSGENVDWFSGDSTVASVDDAGLVVVRGNGQTWVYGQVANLRDSVQLTVDSPLPCLPVGDLAVPDTVDDGIVPGACGPEEPYTAVWKLELDEAKLITIDLISPDFNTFLVLLDDGGDLVGADNDSGVAFNSQLIAELPQGTYYALVMPYSVGAGGNYQLRTREGVPPSRCPATATISFPDTVASSTSTDGSCDYEGFYIDVWRMDIADTTVVTLEAVGDGVGMYAALTDTLGAFLIGGLEGPSDGSWIEATFPPGSYDIWLSTRDPGTTGSYTLRAKQGPASQACPATGTVAVNDAVNGSLVDDDCWVWLAPSDAWDLTVTDTTALTMAVNAADPTFPAILVSDTAGSLVGVGFQDEERYARLDTTLVPGSYRVWIQSADLLPGDYHLSVVEAGSIGACEPVDTAAMDSTHEGALSTTDCALVDGRYVDGWTLELDSARTTTIALTTDKFDAYLFVRDSTGTTIGRDDDGGAGVNASITLDLEAGTYTLWATSYVAHAIGGYTLDVATAVAGLLADGSVEDRGKKRPYPRTRWLDRDEVRGPGAAWIQALNAAPAGGGVDGDSGPNGPDRTPGDGSPRN